MLSDTTHFETLKLSSRLSVLELDYNITIRIHSTYLYFPAKGIAYRLPHSQYIVGRDAQLLHSLSRDNHEIMEELLKYPTLLNDP